MSSSERDLVDAILEDHAEIKRLFARVESATGAQQAEAFEDLMGKLVMHETAEQELVHPLLRKAGDEAGAEARLSEEKEGEKALAELQKKGTDDPQFPALLASLKADVLRHAEAEETEEHPQIRASVEPGRLQTLAKAFDAAQKVAPTRPHPAGPTSATGNIAVGPMAAMFDRARDAVREAVRKVSA